MPEFIKIENTHAAKYVLLPKLDWFIMSTRF